MIRRYKFVKQSETQDGPVVGMVVDWAVYLMIINRYVCKTAA